ncbi:MAG: hypothetical protein JXR70_01570 [Spirochaetales bacterium]|nr:hypothetical protein [Spirochaetales bacterium]
MIQFFKDEFFELLITSTKSFNDQFSVFPVVTGKGYILTYTKRAGIREYVLKGPTELTMLDDVTKIKVEDVVK